MAASRIGVMALGFMLVGCAPGTVTILSQPEGAYISASGKGLGTAPLTQRITDNGSWVKDATGCYPVPEITAQWASGASAVERTRLCGGLRGNYTITLSRPANAPGLNQDLAVANQQAATRAQQQQAQAQRDMAAIQMYNTIQQQNYNQQQLRLQQQQLQQARQPVYTNCTSSGSSVNCSSY